MKEEILASTGKEYFEEGIASLNRGKYNSSIVLFFKALVSYTDLFILNQTGKTPSSHNQRFQITKDKFPEIYNILDKDFPFYQDSYGKVISKELAEVVRDDAKFVATKAGIKI